MKLYLDEDYDVLMHPEATFTIVREFYVDNERTGEEPIISNIPTFERALEWMVKGVSRETNTKLSEDTETMLAIKVTGRGIFFYIGTILECNDNNGEEELAFYMYNFTPALEGFYGANYSLVVNPEHSSYTEYGDEINEKYFLEVPWTEEQIWEAFNG